MYKSDAPYIIDWFAVSLRWFALVGAVVSLALIDHLVTIPGILLIPFTIWNIFLTWMAGTSRRLVYHRPINLAVDLIITALVYWLEGNLLGGSTWLIFLSLASGAAYFDLLGGIGVAIFLALVEAGNIFLNKVPELYLGLTAVVGTLVLGGLLGYLSQREIESYRLARLQTIAAREKKQHTENDRLRAIYNLTSTLAATLSYKRVLDAALDLTASALHVDDATSDDVTPQDDRIVSAVLLFKQDELRVGSARRLTQADMRATFPAKEGLLAHALEEGVAIVTGSTAKDPELARLMSFRNCNSVYCYPMRSGFNIYGALIFGHPEMNYFTSDRCDVLAIIARQAVVAIQNARLYQDIADEKERIVEVQEEARKKLARDLHDGPTQSVAAMAMRVNLARRMIERDPKLAMEELEKIEDLARRTSKEIRHMLFTLRPLVLESQGLAAALQAMADKMKETFSQDVIIQVDENLASQLEMGKSGVIFYIVEEAVTNARKHAQAPHIWVRLIPLPKQPDIAYLEIADNGLGFDVAAMNKSYDKRGSLGMVNLRERSELVNGILNIDSALGKGAKIQVYIPLTEEASDMLHHALDRDQN